MTEFEWGSSTDPTELLDYIAPRLSPRKLRLLAIACCRLAVSSFRPDFNLKLLSLGERVADGLASDSDVRSHLLRFQWDQDLVSSPAKVLRLDNAAHAIHAALYSVGNQDLYFADLVQKQWPFVRYAPEAFEPVHQYVTMASIYSASAFAEDPKQIHFNRSKEDRVGLAFAYQAELFRDIIGNPFDAAVTRSVENAGNRFPAIRTTAGDIYSRGEFGRLTELVDRLHEVGVEKSIVLARIPNLFSHHRGCWLVDAALGVS